MWYIHAVDYYSATKRNELLVLGTTFENTLSKRRQAQKATYCMISFR